MSVNKAVHDLLKYLDIYYRGRKNEPYPHSSSFVIFANNIHAAVDTASDEDSTFIFCNVGALYDKAAVQPNKKVIWYSRFDPYVSGEWTTKILGARKLSTIKRPMTLFVCSNALVGGLPADDSGLLKNSQGEIEDALEHPCTILDEHLLYSNFDLSGLDKGKHLSTGGIAALHTRLMNPNATIKLKGFTRCTAQHPPNDPHDYVHEMQILQKIGVIQI